MLDGVSQGVISAVKQDTWLDYFLRVVSLSGLSLPSFWLGLLVLTAFVQWFGWIPIYTDKPETLWDELVLLSIPAAAVGFRASALIMRLTRSSMLEVMRQDYIRTARAKGLTERRVIYRHAFKAALVSVIPVLGVQAGFVIGGAVYIETVFQWPGIGDMLVKAIRTRDLLLVQGGVLVVAVGYLLFNLLADFAQSLLHPRLRP